MIWLLEEDYQEESEEIIIVFQKDILEEENLDIKIKIKNSNSKKNKVR